MINQINKGNATNKQKSDPARFAAADIMKVFSGRAWSVNHIAEVCCKSIMVPKINLVDQPDSSRLSAQIYVSPGKFNDYFWCLRTSYVGSDIYMEPSPPVLT